MIFQDFYFFFLMTNNTMIFFILAFLVIENILILFHHSFHVSQEKTNWYNLTNFCQKSINPLQKYPHYKYLL